MTARSASKSDPVRVLLIDDDPEDHIITKNLIEDLPGRPFVLDWVDGYDEGLASITAGSHDVYLLDYRLGERDGIRLLGEARAKNPNVAVILLTGQGEYEIDRKATEAGAADYLEKDRLDGTLLERSIRHAILQKQLEAQLESKVAARTAELGRLNEDLKKEIAERKKAEGALREADRRKDEFLATLAHELRNPLAPIRNALSIMGLKSDRPEVVERARGMIDRQVGHMVRLIDELMDISRITRGKLALVPERLPLSEILATAIESSMPQIDKAKLSLVLAAQPTDVILTADRLRMAQVISNLLNNAAKYTAPGGQITVAVEVKPEAVNLSIRDTGIGIAPEQMPYLFELFTQIDRKLGRAQSGLGIGLAMADRLVRLHGGTLDASSPGLGQGSTFTVRLPRESV